MGESLLSLIEDLLNLYAWASVFAKSDRELQDFFICWAQAFATVCLISPINRVTDVYFAKK